MEVDKSKCSICELSCHQKGLCFFKIPEEESSLKVWIKEISPFLNIFKIRASSLKENARICARHFREKDFINCKRNVLVQSACPGLSVSNVNFKIWEKLMEELDGKKSLLREEQSSDGSEKDIFQCGRCKSKFQMLSEFLDHKKFQCPPINRKPNENVTEKTEYPAAYDLLPVENLFKLNGIESHFNVYQDEETYTNSSSEQIVKIVSQEPSPVNKIMSLVMSDGLVVGNPDDISAISTQVILSPQLPQTCKETVIENPTDLPRVNQVILTPQILADDSFLINNMESQSQVRNLIITDKIHCSNIGIVYDCPFQASDRMVIASEVSTTNELPTEIPNTSETFKGSFNYDKLNGKVDAYALRVPEGEEKYKHSGEIEVEKMKTKLPCSFCGKVFEKPFNLQQHERVHTGERPFQCIVCGRAFTQKSNVRKHMMRHRVWPKGKQTLKLKGNQGTDAVTGEFPNEIDYSCQYCTLSFKSYAEHKKHLAIHSNFKVYRCIQKSCNETFHDLDEFLSHSKLHSSAEFQCHICLKIFTNLEELGVHQYDHDTTRNKQGKGTEIKLKCKVCHARFKTTESLKNHLAVDTHNYECVHCKSVFCSERFLRRHLFIHMDSSQSKFKCQNCKKSFRTQQNLKNHVFIHLKEKPFTCDHCDKQFASKYRLKRHVAIHLNQYLECPFKKHLGCDRTFYRKDKLRDHVNTHSQCKLRSCRICSKMYWTLSKLHQHMKRDHKSVKGPKEVLRCCDCSQTFRKRKQLSRHHCTVERRLTKVPRRSSGGGENEVISEAVSNIEIIMVPFDAHEENLT